MQFGTVMDSFYNLRIWLEFGLQQGGLPHPKVFQMSPYKYLDRIFA
jgi:hypothetical protein